MSIDFKDFQNSLTYTATASVAQIFQDLDKLAELNQESEKKKPLFTGVFIVGLLGFFVALFLISSVPIIALILLAASLIVAIGGGKLMNKYNRIYIPSYRYELSRRVLSLLDRDLKENTNINIHLIFSHPTLTSKQISTEKHAYRRGWDVQLFQDQWCSFEGEFSDRNHFQLSVTEFHRIASGRNQRGKYKSKTKLKGSEIYLRLNFNQRQYGAIRNLKQDARSAIQIPPFTTISKLDITDKLIFLKIKVDPEESTQLESLYQAITMMFLSLYQILNLAQMQSKQK